MGPDIQYSSERPLDPLSLEIYRGCDGTLTLYEDDGETSAYQNGAFAETRFEMTEEPEGLICRLGERRGSFGGQYLPQTILLNIHQQAFVNSVYCDDVAVPAADSLRDADSSWWWSAEKQILTIELKLTTDSRVIKVS
jgi:hypothetical protein